MSPEEEDSIIDSLPQHLRNKVLAAWGDGGVAPQGKGERIWPKVPWFRFIFCALWGLAWTALGMACLVTLVLAPLGLICFFIGGFPMVLMLMYLMGTQGEKKA